VFAALAVFGAAQGATKTVCDVVNALRNAGASDSDMRDCKLAFT